MTTGAEEAAGSTVGLCCYRHPDRPTGVRCTRCERPICPDCMVPASVGFQCPECVSQGAKTVRQAKTVYGGRVTPGAKPGIVTQVLIGINVLMFIVTSVGHINVGSNGGTSSLFEHLSLIPPAVAHGQWYRLVTATFLHFNVLHILFNMYALFIVGTPLEAMLGRIRYLALYLLSGIGGCVLSLLLGPLELEAAGASGAVFGLFAALWILARHQGLQATGLTVTIGINLALSFSFHGQIDWRGHVGGLITGAAIAAVMAYAPRGPNRVRLQAAGVAGVALVVAGLGALGAHQAQHRCETATNNTDAGFCAFYDPASRPDDPGRPIINN